MPLEVTVGDEVAIRGLYGVPGARRMVMMAQGHDCVSSSGFEQAMSREMNAVVHALTLFGAARPYTR